MKKRRRPLAVKVAGLALVALLGALALFLLRRWYRYEPHIEVPIASELRIGYNLDYPGDWTNLPPFIDNFKNARGFHGACASDEPDCHPTAHLDLDERGWVKSLRYRDDPARAYHHVEVIVNTSQARWDVGSAFVVTWQGQGELEVQGSTDATRDPARRRITFTLPSETLLFRLTPTDPQGNMDYLRNVQVFRADHEVRLLAGEVWSPEVLSFLEPFKSLRFMDWMQSNSYGRCSGGTSDGKDCYAVSHEVCEGGGVCVMPGKWSERPTAEQAFWFSAGQFLDNSAPARGTKLGGYPLEIMVALANQAGAAPHFNIPAHYEDEYVREFAEYVKKHLRPELPVSVEYSNEVWNWGFPQANYAKQRGAELWPEDGTAFVQFMAARTHHMCRLFRQVFAGQEQRLRCLISPQTGWRELAETVLDCPAWVELHPEDASCTMYVDAINVSGYFAGCLPSQPAALLRWLGEGGRDFALEQAFEQLEHGGLIDGCAGEAVDNLDFAIEQYGHFMQLAARRGLGLEVYESGTHFEYGGRDGDREDIKQLLVDMTSDPRMYDLYVKNYRGFIEAGGSTFNVWGWVAPNDAWANATSVIDREHPKYRASADFAAIAASLRRGALDTSKTSGTGAPP